MSSPSSLLFLFAVAEGCGVSEPNLDSGEVEMLESVGTRGFSLGRGSRFAG